MLDVLPSKPGSQREAFILDAVAAGKHLPLDWVPLTVQHSGHSMEVLVMGDALRLGDDARFLRVTVTHRTAQQVADLLDGALPTTRISDYTHVAAGAKLRACLQKPDAGMASTQRMWTHSDAVTEARQAYGKPSLASTVGKDWVLTNSLVGRPDRAANYGWHDTGAAYESPGGLAVWQPLGLAHDLDHVDYSQVVRLVSRKARLDGAEVDLFDLLVDAKLSEALSYEGPLKLLRHPGVLPFTPVNSKETLGQRCVRWCISHLGTPTASSKVREWLEPCARGYGHGRKILGLKSGNWCSALQCAAMRACLLPGETAPHDYRAGVVELVQDTTPGHDGWVPFGGRYKPIAETLERNWMPAIGDLAIWDRSEEGKPDSHWWRHVNRVVEYRENGQFRTIGGNEGGTVGYGQRSVKDPKLLGWIHYPDASRCEADDLTQDEQARLANDIYAFSQYIVGTLTWDR